MQTRLFVMLTFAISVTACSGGAVADPAVTQSTTTVPTTVQATTTTPTVTTSVASATTVIEEPEGVTFVGNCEGVSQEAAEAAAGTPLGSLTEDEYEDAGIVHRCFWSGPQGDVAVIVSSAKGDFADEVASLTTGCEGGAVEGVGDEAAGYVCERPAEIGGGFTSLVIVRVGDMTVQGSLTYKDTFDPLIPFLSDAVLPTILTPNG